MTLDELLKEARAYIASAKAGTPTYGTGDPLALHICKGLVDLLGVGFPCMVDEPVAKPAAYGKRPRPWFVVSSDLEMTAEDARGYAAGWLRAADECDAFRAAEEAESK